MTFDTLIVVRDQANLLIREEVRTLSQRKALEAAVRDAVTKLECSVDEVSAASGLTVVEINRILAEPAPIEELDLVLSLR